MIYIYSKETTEPEDDKENEGMNEWMKKAM